MYFSARLKNVLLGLKGGFGIVRLLGNLLAFDLLFLFDVTIEFGPSRSGKGV
jgi:hypothetical protein